MLPFAFMVISAQMRLGGFCPWATRRLGILRIRPPALHGAIISVASTLSALFSNDIVRLALALVLVDVCLPRRLDPVRLLLVLTCTANIGSAAALIAETLQVPAAENRDDPYRQLDVWQTGKGLTVAVALFAAFLFVPWPRDLMALAGAGPLLSSRKLHSRHMPGLVDRQILILFIGLLVVNRALQQTGLSAHVV
jgi:Na+/H+ antiporter NhaD/arsenite permease-like protein